MSDDGVQVFGEYHVSHVPRSMTGLPLRRSFMPSVRSSRIPKARVSLSKRVMLSQTLISTSYKLGSCSDQGRMARLSVVQVMDLSIMGSVLLLSTRPLLGSRTVHCKVLFVTAAPSSSTIHFSFL